MVNMSLELYTTLMHALIYAATTREDFGDSQEYDDAYRALSEMFPDYPE
jgi:hypothetical protein